MDTEEEQRISAYRDMDESEVWKRFGGIISLAKKKKGLTLQRLADESCISLTMMHRIVNGKAIPKADVIRRLAFVLEIPTDWLLSMPCEYRRIK